MVGITRAWFWPDCLYTWKYTGEFCLKILKALELFRVRIKDFVLHWNFLIHFRTQLIRHDKFIVSLDIKLHLKKSRQSLKTFLISCWSIISLLYGVPRKTWQHSTKMTGSIWSSNRCPSGWKKINSIIQLVTEMLLICCL